MNSFDECVRYLEGDVSFRIDSEEERPALEQFIQKVRRSTAEMGILTLSKSTPLMAGLKHRSKRKTIDTKTNIFFLPVSLKPLKEKQRQTPLLWFLLKRPYIALYNMDTLEVRPFFEASTVEIEGQSLIITEDDTEERFEIRLSTDQIGAILKMRPPNNIVRFIECLEISGQKFTPHLQIWEFLVDFIFTPDLLLCFRVLKDVWADETIISAWVEASTYYFESIWESLIQDEFTRLESPEALFNEPSFLSSCTVALFRKDTALTPFLETVIAAPGFMVRTFLAEYHRNGVGCLTSLLLGLLYKNALAKWGDERDALSVISHAILRAALIPVAQGAELDGSLWRLLSMQQTGVALDDVILYEACLESMRTPPLNYITPQYNYTIFSNTIKLWPSIADNLELMKRTAESLCR